VRFSKCNVETWKLLSIVLKTWITSYWIVSKMVEAVTRAQKNGETSSPSFSFTPLPYLSSKQTDTDLKAFERRLTEVITCLRPGTIRWRIILVVASICTAIGAWQWINDPLTSASQVSFLDSLLNHIFFTMSSLILGLLFLTGIHKRVVAPAIITQRTRVVLADFNMSCDETGKLILRPRPTNS